MRLCYPKRLSSPYSIFPDLYNTNLEVLFLCIQPNGSRIWVCICIWQSWLMRKLRNHYFRQIDLLLCSLYSVSTIHTNSAVSVVIEVIHQFVQNNNFSPYVISQLSHIHIRMHTHIRLSENLPIVWNDNK